MLSNVLVAVGDTAAMERVSRARSMLIIRQPFWGTLALYLKLETSRLVRAMATDGFKLYVNPDWVMTTDFDELVGVIAHEVSHCAYRHHVRRGNRELALWNDACDYVINPYLLGAGFKLPEGALVRLPPDLGVFDHSKFSAEEVYARLYAAREAKKAASGGQGKSGQAGDAAGQSQPSGGSGSAPGQSQPSSNNGAGAGAGSPQPKVQPQPGSQASGSAGKAPGKGTQPGSGSPGDGGGDCEWGGVIEPVKEHEKANAAAIEAEWEVRVKQAVNIAKAKHAGHLPGDIERLVENVERPAKVDWREKLRQFINDKAICDYSWVHRNRRFNDIILPGQVVSSIEKLGIGVDTSSSRNGRALALVENEVQDIMDTGTVAELVVVYCDAAVQRVERFVAGDTVKLNHKGGGGTKFSPAIEWFTENEPNAPILYFTDLECSDWGTEPQAPVMWLGCGFESKIEQLAQNVPFGEVVHIEE